MGFTPLDGLVMATRSGRVDPGLLIWLQQHAGLGVSELADGLEHQSGLAGLSGTSGDIRDVLTAADAGDHRATLALQVYVHRLRAAVAEMAASMNGLDTLVFTGGIGQHQPVVRSATASGLQFLGIGVDEPANHSANTDADISSTAARVHTLVVTAREDLEIARQVRLVLEPSKPTGPSAPG